MRRIKALDAVVAAVFLFAAVSSLGLSSKGDQVRIDSAYATYIYPLDEDRTVTVPGPLGDTVVRIEDSTFRIVSSPCPGQTCLHMRMGSSVCCLPNRVLVSLDDGNGGADAISY